MCIRHLIGLLRLAVWVSCGGFLVKMVNFQDRGALVLQHCMFSEPVGMGKGENVLHIYIYNLKYDELILKT